MRSLICFAFLMSASICMLTVTPVQVSADGDTDNLTDNSDIVLADSKKKPAKAEGDEVEEKTQKQIKEEKDGYDDRIAAKDPGISDVNELIENEKKKLKKAGGTTTDDLIALGIPDPADYDTDREWHKAFAEWAAKNGYTLEESLDWYNKWLKVARPCKNLLAHQKTLAALLAAQEKIGDEKEAHCEKWPDKRKERKDGSDGGND